MLAGAAVPSAPPSLIIRNRWPSGEISYDRPHQLRNREVPLLHHQRRRRGRPRWAARHPHAHERTRRGDIDQLLPAPRPDWPRAAVGGHLPVTAVHVRERPHIDFDSARVIRLVGEPAAVGRDAPVPLVERGLHERRHAAGPVQFDHHHVVGRSWSLLGEDQPAAIGRNRRRVLGVGTFGQPLDRAGCRPRPARTDSALPPVPNVKITRRLSGVHTPMPSTPGANVRRVSVVRPRSQSQRSCS